MTRIGIGVSTNRPSDAVVVESAEVTGIDAFEEIINVDDISRVADPMKERLMEIARQRGPALGVVLNVRTTGRVVLMKARLRPCQP